MRLDRVNEMEQYVLRRGTASLEDLTEEFQISLNTVRRDVSELLRRGRIRKTYGGVAAVETAGPVPMAKRYAKNREEKLLIGQLAAGLVENGQTVFLDSGSTIPAMLPHLSRLENVTIVTHSLSVMSEASQYPNLKVIALGGLYSPDTNSYVGLSTLEGLERISVDTVFIAATGVSLERGLTNTTYFEAEIKQRVVRRGSRVVLLADESKFDFISTISFYDFKKLYAVVTNRRPPIGYVEAARVNGIRLLFEEGEPS